MSLIDFSEEPEPATSAAPSQQAPRPQQHPVSAPTSHPVNAPSVSGGDWASFDAFGQQQTQQSGSSANPLESALAQLSFSETPSVPNSSVNDGGQSTVVDQSQSLFDASFGISGNQVITFVYGFQNLYTYFPLFRSSFHNILFSGPSSNVHPRNFSSATFSYCSYTWISISDECESARSQWYSRSSIFY